MRWPAVTGPKHGVTVLIVDGARDDPDMADRSFLSDASGTGRMTTWWGRPLSTLAKLYLFVAYLSLGGFPTAYCQPPDVQGEWKPRWLVRAIEKLTDLAGEGPEPGRLIHAAGQVAASRVDGDYTEFADGVLLTAAFDMGVQGATPPTGQFTEAEKMWIVYMEEAMLIDYLEEHFPASSRALWSHMSLGGSFPDHLQVTTDMLGENIPRFHQLRQWTPCLQSMWPRSKGTVHVQTQNDTRESGMEAQGPASSSDVVSLVGQRINKKWLKSPSPRGRSTRARTRPVTVTRETCDLSAWTGPRRRRSSSGHRGTAHATTPSSSGRSKPTPKPMPKTRQAEGRAPETPAPEAHPPPLTMQEAVSNWLVWLGIMDIGEEPTRFLPLDIEHRILDNFMDLHKADQLTTAMALTSMIQQLMASVGGILQDAIQMAPRRHRAGTEAEEIEVEVEADAEPEESGLMQTGISSSWYRVLQDLREALEQMTKQARRDNVRWLRRRVHHRCTNTASGYFLGHAQGRVGELVALLAAAVDDTHGEEAEGENTLHCSTWVLKWWAILEPHLPISQGSLLASGHAVPNEDPVVMLFSKPIPEDASADNASADEPAAPGNPTRLAGPRPPTPVRPLLTQSPTEDELVAAAEMYEEERARQQAREQEQADRERQEEAYLRDMERIYEEHRAAVYRDWEEWVLQEEMSRPSKRSRGMLQLTVRSGNPGEAGVSSSVPISLDAESRGTVTLHLAYHEPAPTTPSTVRMPAQEAPPAALPDATQGDAEVGRGDALLDAATEQDQVEAQDRLAALSVEQLDTIYQKWVSGLLSTHEVLTTYGRATLHTIQMQRLAYYDGAVFHEMEKQALDEGDIEGMARASTDSAD